MNTKSLYQAAYRNARCMRNLDARATLQPLPRSSDTTVIASDAMDSLHERKCSEAYGDIEGWTNVSRYNQWAALMNRRITVTLDL